MQLQGCVVLAACEKGYIQLQGQRGTRGRASGRAGNGQLYVAYMYIYTGEGRREIPKLRKAAGGGQMCRIYE